MEWDNRLSSVYRLMSSLADELWPLLNPGSRLFILNIISAILISIVFLVFFRTKFDNSPGPLIIKDETVAFKINWSYLFNKSYWLHPSALVDYKIYLINGFIKVLFFAPILGLSLYFSMYTIKFCYLLFPDFNPKSGNTFLYLIATLFVFVWDDFSRFFHHRLMHKIPFLWSLHKTHHSAEVLTPITLYRIHPLESVLATFRNAFSYGVSSGVFMFIFSGSVNLVTFFGINAIGFIFNLTAANLRHSEIPISFGFLEYVFISPKQHQLHHSNKPEHFDKNFGVALSIWDLLLGSFLRSKNETISGYGVDDVDSKSLTQQFWPSNTFYKNALDGSTQKINNTQVNFFSAKRFSILAISHLKIFQFMALIMLLFNPIETKAYISCAMALSDKSYFVENRFVNITAMNVILNTRSDLPGRFRATLIQPRGQKGRTLPAYFEKYTMERKYIQLRHPAGPEVHGLWVSGHLEWFEDELGKSELVLMITNLWRKDLLIQFEVNEDPLIYFHR